MRQPRAPQEDGASMVEYGLLLAAIALVVAAALPLFADWVAELFGRPLPFFTP